MMAWVYAAADSRSAGVGCRFKGVCTAIQGGNDAVDVSVGSPYKPEGVLIFLAFTACSIAPCFPLHLPHLTHTLRVMTAAPPARIALPERRKSGILEDPTQTPTSVNAMSAVFHKPEGTAEPSTFKPKNNPAFILHGKLKTSYEEVSVRKCLSGTCDELQGA